MQILDQIILRTNPQNYKKTEYFDDYFPFFEEVYTKTWNTLSNLNEYMLRWFLKQLGIKVNFLKASELDLVGKKSDLVLDMCNKLKATTYIFGELGKEYAEITKFQNANIKTIFQKYNHPEYLQNNNQFVSNLSIIDLLFNCGPRSFKILMKNNMTKKEVKK